MSEIRHAFSKNGGNLGEQGSVAWLFERKSQSLVEGENASEDQLMDLLLDAGVDDIRDDGGTWQILASPELHEAVIQALAKAGIPTISAEIAMVPKNVVKLEGKNAQAMIRLYDVLEEHDDVQSVYGNYELDDASVEALA